MLEPITLPDRSGYFRKITVFTDDVQPGDVLTLTSRRPGVGPVYRTVVGSADVSADGSLVVQVEDRDVTVRDAMLTVHRLLPDGFAEKAAETRARAQEVITALDGLRADAALLVLDHLLSTGVGAWDAPALTLNEEELLVCPVCGDVLDEEGITARDVAVRDTDSHMYDAEDRVLGVSYDGHGDYEGVCYTHNGCGFAVTLPEGWTEA